MLQKWRTLLINWINCYFNESPIKEQNVTLESILNIISHLRENFSLDESKSSILEAHTVGDFIREKYPDFKFSNGKLEAETEEELYMVASLLLLFVCVNSKDVDLKNAMCSKLSIDDQEVILKFSKCLLDCSPVTYKDVQAAVMDACGNESAVAESENACNMVPETPPALRSLHSEVRRLQAALDTERFDRNYLQEELSRSNLRLQQLLKDKEKHKTDIINLKAKISMCCGEESNKNANDVATEGTAKLLKQLEEIEERLVQTQGQLDDAQYERDLYKVKVNELKQERDKLITLHKQELSRNTQLSEKLETEQLSSKSLRELVTELQQHQKLNKLDSSQLECDDPDASINSLQHNTSICTEACANVVEVQLGEERAKIVVLMQQIQSLQDQLNEYTQKNEIEKLSLEKTISEKDNDIFNLKHRINEEIEIKNHMMVHYSDEVSQLNNKINELEQKVKDNNIQYTLLIETKMQEVHTLQEDKLSLLHSFYDESNKLDNMIKNLKTDLENEKVSKAKLKEESDNNLMKLNEKVLNRNNELVELQNNVVLLSEQIEGLHLELRKEKQATDNTVEYYRNELEVINIRRLEIESSLQEKCELIESLTDKLNNNNSHIDELNSELDYFKTSISQLTETCNVLNQDKTSLVNEIDIRDNKIEQQNKEIDNLRNKYSEKKDNYNKIIDEYETRIRHLAKSIEDTHDDMVKQRDSYNAVVDSRDRDIHTLQQENTTLHEELNELKQELDHKVHSLEERLIENEKLTDKLKSSYECQIDNLNLMVTKLTNYLKDKTTELDGLRNEKESLQEIIGNKNQVITTLEEKIKKVQDDNDTEKLDFNNKYSILQEDNVKAEKQLEDRWKEIQIFKDKIQAMTVQIDAYERNIKEKDTAICNKEDEVIAMKQELNSAVEQFQDNISKQTQSYTALLASRQQDIEILQKENNSLHKELSDIKHELEQKAQSLEEILCDNEKLTDNLKSTYESQIENLNSMAAELTASLKEKLLDFEVLTKEKEHLEEVIENSNKDMSKQKESFAAVLEARDSDIQTLQKENKMLQEQLNDVKHELDDKVHALENKLVENENLTKQLRSDYESQIDVSKVTVADLTNSLKEKTMDIELMAREKEQLQVVIENSKEVITTLEETMKKVQDINDTEKLDFNNKYSILQEHNVKAEKQLEDRQKEIQTFKDKIQALTVQIDAYERNIREKDTVICNNEDEVIAMKQELNSAVEQFQDNISKQTQSYTALLASRQQDIEILQKENNSLHKELSDIKHELEQKAQSLEEKLCDNEKLTDNLKSTYESQIENLNSMAAELTASLKEKLLDFEVLTKEKEHLEEVIENSNKDMSKQKESFAAVLEARDRDIQTLQKENKMLQEQLNDVMHELDEKVYALEKKLVENENLTKQLRTDYESQIDISKVTVADLTNSLKEKTMDIELMAREREQLQVVIENSKEVITTLEEAMKKVQDDNDTKKRDFNNKYSILQEHNVNAEMQLEDRQKEIQTFKDKIQALTVQIDAYERNIKEKDTAICNKEDEVIAMKQELNSAMEQFQDNISKQTQSYTSLLASRQQDIEILQKENNSLHKELTDIKHELEQKAQSLEEKLCDNEKLTDNLKTTYESQIENLNSMAAELTATLKEKLLDFEVLTKEKEHLQEAMENSNQDISKLKESYAAVLEARDREIQTLQKENTILQEQLNDVKHELDDKVHALENKLVENENLTKQLRTDYESQIDVSKVTVADLTNSLKEKTMDIELMAREKEQLQVVIENSKEVIHKLEETAKEATNQYDSEKLNLNNKCSILEECQMKAGEQLDDMKREIRTFENKVQALTVQIEDYENGLKEKDAIIRNKEENISNMKQELKAAVEQLQIELSAKDVVISELKHKLENVNHKEAKVLRNEEWIQAMAQRDLFAVATTEKTSSHHKHSGHHENRDRDFQVDNTTSDLGHSSMESLKTISDLEKIIHDKNRTITTLQSDISYLKSLIADSEIKVLDITKELELSKENCQQLSSQLKKIVHVKNEEIADLKKQVSKMSATENRASQIVKVSAKYQAIILKRIAEIKTNTVLKELTNFGNTNNGDNELRRSLNAGTITMEDLENFLETTEKHIRRCSEKQISLQKERDRLVEVNRINDSEIINLKKFLTELSVSFKTFSNIKELYTQKLSRVVSVQRTVRREILKLDGRINDATMCKLERGYAAVMQDLSEAVMNLERWVERCISRTISAEKIKQAFMSDEERASLPSTTFQNASLEVQLGELENSFQKLLEEVVLAQKGDGAKDAQAITVMEVRAEYEDKLNRMKVKMNELYQAQISVYKEKQREEVVTLERELTKARHKLADSSKAYEDHIRVLTTELWRVGEKFLTKKDELEWLKKKQFSSSLMSLQHVHSSGLAAPQEETSRISDAHSLRSLPVVTNPKKREGREGRGLHMSDEEGEVFDNRWLHQLATTPRRSPPPGPRLSELRWRNSLCPPHLKSSYPAETQFTAALDEEDIKCFGAASLGGRNQRKEVGITAYKKPGPPTPSKQAGRLSATDSELRESLRFEPEPQVSRKTSTPSRLRALFRSGKNDTADGTPRSRRLSIFRKK